MKKAMVLGLITVLCLGMFGCAPASSTKIIEAYTISISVPNEWGDFSESAGESTQLFGYPAEMKEVASPEGAKVTVIHASESPIAYDYLEKVPEDEIGMALESIRINGAKALRAEQTTSAGDVTILIIPQTSDNRANTAVAFEIKESEYQANKDVYESIINSIKVQ